MTQQEIFSDDIISRVGLWSDVTASTGHFAAVKAGGERSSEGFATVVGHSTAGDDFKLATNSILSRSYLGT